VFTRYPCYQFFLQSRIWNYFGGMMDNVFMRTRSFFKNLSILAGIVSGGLLVLRSTAQHSTAQHSTAQQLQLG